MPNFAPKGSPRAFLTELFQAAVAAAQPAICLPPDLPSPPRGRTVVVGAGKAAAAMARVLEDHWRGPLSGIVVTQYGYGVACAQIEIVEAAHPVPDAAGAAAGRRILECVRGLSADDLVICLISGGGSALMPVPLEGLDLGDKIAVNQALLRCGATISEINCVRKHLSAIKGGRLAAAAAPARIVTLAISDVPGDDPAVIASGPTVPDPTNFADARAILARYGVVPPPAVRASLKQARLETPKPGDSGFVDADYVTIAAPQASLMAAAAVARAAGVAPVILGDAIEGEARDVALVHAGIAGPAVLLSGGETTVTLRGQGRGGRNAEFALALAIALEGTAGIAAIACDTDGIDGSEDNAGALVLSDTLARAAAAGLNPRARLDDNDAYSFFCAIGDLVMTGPTFTNVNDFRAILITRPPIFE
jgi:hydroxypyruvate reductase